MVGSKPTNPGSIPGYPIINKGDIIKETKFEKVIDKISDNVANLVMIVLGLFLIALVLTLGIKFIIVGWHQI